MDVGINLAPVNDWNREWVFTDLFKQSRVWKSIDDGTEINNLEYFNFSDGHGVQTMLLVNQEGHYPKGSYNVFYKGNGAVRFKGPGVSVKEQRELNNGKYISLDVQGDNGILMQVFDAPITDVSVVWPNFQTYYRHTFHPLYVWDLRRFKYIRFLNWMNTNEVVQPRVWDTRTKPTSTRQSYTEDGVCLEYMVELCNQTKCDPWFCMPHIYHDDYIVRFAQYVKSNLDPSLKIYVEFSNETWNAIFPQNQWFVKEAGYRSQKWPEVVADEAKKVWDSWDAVFYDQKTRIIKVIGGNAASTWPINLMLSRWGDYKPDLVCVATYFGPTPIQLREIKDDITPEDLLNLSRQNIPLRKQFVQNHITLCADHNIAVGVYEGGQGIVGKGAWLKAAYDSQILPEMYQATFDMMKESEDLGCPVYGVFQYAGNRKDQHGSWGHFEFQYQSLLSHDDLKFEAPKMSAVRDFIKGVK